MQPPFKFWSSADHHRHLNVAANRNIKFTLIIVMNIVRDITE
jgi:hypothetical protein